METYYIDNTSGSIRNLLLAQKHLSSGALAGVDYDLSHTIPWFNGDKESAESLADFLSTETSDIIDIYDNEANLVASTRKTGTTKI